MSDYYIVQTSNAEICAQGWSSQLNTDSNARNGHAKTTWRNNWQTTGCGEYWCNSGGSLCTSSSGNYHASITETSPTIPLMTYEADCTGWISGFYGYGDTGYNFDNEVGGAASSTTLRYFVFRGGNPSSGTFTNAVEIGPQSPSPPPSRQFRIVNTL